MNRTDKVNKFIKENPEFKKDYHKLLNSSEEEFKKITASKYAVIMPEGSKMINLKALGFAIPQNNTPEKPEIAELPIPQNEIEDKPAKKGKFIDRTIFSALDLYNLNISKVPKLLDPFLQKVGIAALVGTSDSGKSTFLRQLSLAIALKQDNFLGFKLNSESNRVIYVSTEDDSNTVSYAIRKQINNLKNEQTPLDIKLLNNLSFIFDSDNLLKTIETKVENEGVDLVIIDAFADVFTKEINANTQVRQFLNEYDQLAKKYGFLILFLHHTGKRTNGKIPSKDNIIGSQAFEAKMRSVLELKPNSHARNRKDLWVLKANFLEPKYKDKSYILDFGKDLIFSYTGSRGSVTDGKSANPELISKVKELHEKGLSVRKIEDALRGTEMEIGKSTVNKILQDNP